MTPRTIPGQIHPHRQIPHVDSFVAWGVTKPVDLTEGGVPNEESAHSAAAKSNLQRWRSKAAELVNPTAMVQGPFDSDARARRLITEEQMRAVRGMVGKHQVGRRCSPSPW